MYENDWTCFLIKHNLSNYISNKRKRLKGFSSSNPRRCIPSSNTLQQSFFELFVSQQLHRLTNPAHVSFPGNGPVGGIDVGPSQLRGCMIIVIKEVAIPLHNQPINNANIYTHTPTGFGTFARESFSGIFFISCLKSYRSSKLAVLPTRTRRGGPWLIGPKAFLKLLLLVRVRVCCVRERNMCSDRHLRNANERSPTRAAHSDGALVLAYLLPSISLYRPSLCLCAASVTRNIARTHTPSRSERLMKDLCLILTLNTLAAAWGGKLWGISFFFWRWKATEKTAPSHRVMKPVLYSSMVG